MIMQQKSRKNKVANSLQAFKLTVLIEREDGN